MSERWPTRIINRTTRELVEAFVIDGAPKETLMAVQQSWGPFRQQSLRRLQREGTPWPEHWHWDWSQKAKKLDLLAYRCLGIEYDRTIQGLMMLSTVYRPSRLPDQHGKPTVYIDYLETAPWNLPMLTESPRFAGVGSALLEAAIEFSLQEDCAGRIALHSLPQSEDFYRRYMTEVDVDLIDGISLKYFEMSPVQVQEFPER
jgi:hypothetical protein